MALFKILKSDKTYEITAFSTDSRTDANDNSNFHRETRNRKVDNFSMKYLVDNNAHTVRTPTDKECKKFLSTGDVKGKRWSFFRNENRSSNYQGVIMIYLDKNSTSVYDSDNKSWYKRNINYFKTSLINMSKEVK